MMHMDALAPTTVLVVDDDEAIRESVRMVLEDAGYQVVEAPDGPIALEMLRAFPLPVVVLTNHMMPRLDGPGLINFVHDDRALSGRNRFIYFTAGNRLLPPAFSHQLADLHIPVLRKPFDVSALLDMVDAASRQLASSSDAEGRAETADAH